MTWHILPVVMRVERGGWPPFWLPLILLWPLLFIVFCLALPVCVLLPSRRASAFATVLATYHTLCALHGSEFELSSPEHGRWKFSLY